MLKTFIADEKGAVTVDWVVLTAALVGLGLAVMSVVSGGIENLSTDVAQSLADTEVGFTFASNEITGITDMSGAQIYGPDHNEAHRQDMMTRFYPGLTDGQLLDYYEARKQEYDSRTTNYGNAVDHIGYSQQEMHNRGIEIPEGDRLYSDYAAEYEAENNLNNL